ncbi:MAG: hypothetical protein ACRCU3_09100 [Eubacteriaceae bacterium]
MDWYIANKKKIEEEIREMGEYYPDFKIARMSDGTNRLFWSGLVNANVCRREGVYVICLIYEEPSNNNEIFKILSCIIAPDFNEISEGLIEEIPHVNNVCKDEKSGWTYIFEERGSMSSVKALKKICCWIDLFEFWIAGDITTDAFKSYDFDSGI